MYCVSETCLHAWSDNLEEKCYDCEFCVESKETLEPQEKDAEEQEDCPGQLFFNFFAPSLF